MTGQDPQALRVLRGNPSPEEVAVLTLALLAVSRQSAQSAHCAEEQTAARPRWPRGADPVPAAGQWAAVARPGWCSR